MPRKGSVGASSSMAASQRTQAPDVEKRGRAAGLVLLVFEARNSHWQSVGSIVFYFGAQERIQRFLEACI